MPNPFHEAQANSAEGGYGYEPAPPQAGDMGAQQAPPAGSMDPSAAAPAPQSNFYGGSADEIGQLRDSIMSQFPGSNNIADDDLGYSTGEKMGLIGLALVNPKGALDLVREKRERLLKKRLNAAQMNMSALTLGAHMMDAQNRFSQGLDKMRQDDRHHAEEMKVQSVRAATDKGMLDLQTARQKMDQVEAEQKLRDRQTGLNLTTQGVDESGQEVSAEFGTPGFTSRATQAGLQPSYGGAQGFSLDPSKPAVKTPADAMRAQLYAKLLPESTVEAQVEKAFPGEGRKPGTMGAAAPVAPPGDGAY